ncbi:hypothetical protein HID58_006986 [Brassica napus]|uniref:GOST seven transmembrane domain-containing protein n=1 Tax=Brassica napus TaxID=3708 RepID=A0ABQ8ED29_BRANA|nr:hypothetical protein HID58_006986 [Brassica napus]
MHHASDRNNIGGSAYGGQRSILPLQQHCITVVMVLGLREMVFWYLDYANFNSTGMRLGDMPLALTTWVVVVERLCHRFSYYVFRWDLGLLSPLLVLLVGVSYFIASGMLDIAENVSGRAKLFLVLTDAFLDAFLILWIFTSLSKTLEQLQMKRTSVKLDIYRKFSNALTVLVVASVAWIVYEMPVTQCIVPVCEMVANEEVQCLTGGKQDGDISLEKNTGSDTEEEDKRE